MAEDLVTVEEAEKVLEPNKDTRDNPALRQQLDENYMRRQLFGATTYYDKQDPSKPIIRERTSSLVLLAPDNPRAIRALVDIAQAKGWSEIKVSGNKELAALVAAEAHDRGLIVRGYEPPEKELSDEAAKSEHERPEKEPELDTTVQKEEVTVHEAPEREYVSREEAYKNLNKEEAVSLFPELAQVYVIENEAREFLSANREQFSDEVAMDFVVGVRNGCFEDLDSGKDLAVRRSMTHTQHVELESSAPEAEHAHGA